jgi:hypothetical protein
MAGCGGREFEEGETLEVNAKALFEVLCALNSSQGYMVRELQVTMTLPDSPIKLLTDQYNSWALSDAAKRKST